MEDESLHVAYRTVLQYLGSKVEYSSLTNFPPSYTVELHTVKPYSL